MKTKMKMIAASAIAVLAAAASATAAPVRVAVYQSHSDSGATTYLYRVQNATDQPVVGLKVGFDHEAGVPQLVTPPSGWTVDGGLPPASAAAPAGWTAELVVTEETDLVDMEWHSDGGADFDIAPSATGAGFSVTTPRPAAEYLTSKFDVTLGNSKHVTGTIEPWPDTTAPTIQVTLTPVSIWPPDRKMVAVTATVTADDDIDPHPLVRLVSITANEPLGADDVSGAAFDTSDRQFSLRAERSGDLLPGRIYTVTYSATDGAGNSTTATATVTVPHDQRP